MAWYWLLSKMKSAILKGLNVCSEDDNDDDDGNEVVDNNEDDDDIDDDDDGDGDPTWQCICTPSH